MKKFVLLAASVSVATCTLAYAGGHVDAITMRKNGMQGVGLAMGKLVAMAKGEAPADAKKAAGALKSMNYVANTFGDFFPEGSDSGDTTASPKIWEDMAGFKEKLDEFEGDTSLAINETLDSQEAIQQVVMTLGESCKGCHETYRVKK